MRCLRFFIVAWAALVSGAAIAQGATGAFPSRPVTLVNPLAPGGAIEAEARLYAKKMSELSGQPFLVDFKVGAGGTIGTGYVAKAAPDGATLLVTTTAFSSFPALYKDLPFNTLEDLAPVSLMSEKVIVLVLRASFPATTIPEYVAYAKANPTKLNFGTSGAGGGTHFAGAWLHSATNTQATFVHYKGTGPIVPDLLAGRLDATTSALVVVWPLVKAGKLRVLAITGDKRSNLLPGVQTVAEQGVAGYNYSNWVGILAPGPTPAPIINALSQAFVKVARMPDVAATLEPDGNSMVGSTPEQFKKFLIADTGRWKKVVQDTGLKLE